METYLMNIQRVRIPRPKFTSESHNHRRPYEPPKDYLDDHMVEPHLEKITTRLTNREFSKTTETLQRLTIHDTV